MSPIDPARFHRESLVIDGLNASYFLEPKVLDRLRAGGVTAVNATLAAWHGMDKTMDLISQHYAVFERHSDRVMQVRDVTDIFRAKATGRVGFILGFQGTDPIQDNIWLLSMYYALGVRIMQLTYNATNRVGSGYRMPVDEGLTPFGRQVVREMNRLGILVDLSHCGERTTREAIEHSEQPVAITHANSRRIVDEPRNKSPEVLKAMAAKGGVVGAMAFPIALTGERNATLEDYLNAIDDLVDLVGIDHVGLGPDFMEEMPHEILTQALTGFSEDTMSRFFNAPATTGFESIATLPNVTEGLFRRGYGPPDVKRILGENWLHLYGRVWQSQAEHPVTEAEVSQAASNPPALTTPSTR